MNTTNQEMRATMISKIIDELSVTQRITYLTLYFDNYTWKGLKRLLELMVIDHDKLGVNKDQ